MTHISKRNYKHAILWLTLALLVAFLIYYLPLLYDTGAAITYISYFTVQLINTALPLVSAAVLILKASDSSTKKIFKSALPFSLVRLPYLLPYYYCRFVVDYYDSLEAICLSAIYSLLLMLVFYIEVAVYTIIIRKVLKKSDEAPILNAHPFDLDAPVTYSIAICAIIGFFIDLSFEIYDTVYYFIDYSGTYKLTEILYIILCFVLILVFAIVSHTVACFIKNKLYQSDDAI